MNYISAGPFLTLTRCGTTFNIYDAKGRPGPDALLYPSLYSNECVVPLYLFPQNATIHFRVEATTPLGIVGRASAPVLLNLRTLRNP